MSSMYDLNAYVYSQDIYIFVYERGILKVSSVLCLYDSDGN